MVEPVWPDVRRRDPKETGRRADACTRFERLTQRLRDACRREQSEQVIDDESHAVAEPKRPLIANLASSREESVNDKLCKLMFFIGALKLSAI